MINFHVLASGSKGNCTIIQNHDTKIVIDCGTSKKYLEAAFQKIHVTINDIDALCITHTHKDHIAALNVFSNIPKISYAPLPCEYHKLPYYQSIQMKSMLIQSIPLSHDCENTIGYVIQDQDDTLVYITDTGYLHQNVKPLIEKADYYIFESNHDIEMLMKTKRPMYVKQRIIGDNGHLCNQVSSNLLSEIIYDNTKEIVLAHLSEEGNHPQLALEQFQKTCQRKNLVSHHIKVAAAKQFEIYSGGWKK